MRTFVWMAGLAMLSGVGRAQQAAPAAMGSVATGDALVTGGLEVQGERARLMSNVSITAYNRTAAIALDRGGEVLVCATSQFHLLHSGSGRALFFGLDRGALEIHSASAAGDVILTPDIRFTVEAAGAFDLGLRVTRNGDTCVDNAGKGAPVLVLNDSFTAASYRILPGQHVLFEHGSLLEVVDNERSPCGCPPPEPVSVIASAAAGHPFPAAVSEGLAPATPAANAAPPGQTQTQVSATLGYGPGIQAPPPAPQPDPALAPPTPAAPYPDAAAPPPSPPGAHSIAHSIGRFFHKLFHRGG